MRSRVRLLASGRTAWLAERTDHARITPSSPECRPLDRGPRVTGRLLLRHRDGPALARRPGDRRRLARARHRRLEPRRRQRRLLPARSELRDGAAGHGLRDSQHLRPGRLHVGRRQRGRHLHGVGVRGLGRQLDGGDGTGRPAGQHSRLRGPEAPDRVLLRHRLGLYAGGHHLRPRRTARQGLDDRRRGGQRPVGRCGPQGRGALPAVQRHRPAGGCPYVVCQAAEGSFVAGCGS